MTAKEPPRERIDPLVEMLDAAPLDDELTTPEEEVAVQEAREAADRGETISLEELQAEFAAE